MKLKIMLLVKEMHDNYQCLNFFSVILSCIYIYQSVLITFPVFENLSVDKAPALFFL